MSLILVPPFTGPETLDKSRQAPHIPPSLNSSSAIPMTPLAPPATAPICELLGPWESEALDREGDKSSLRVTLTQLEGSEPSWDWSSRFVQIALAKAETSAELEYPLP